MVLGYSLLRAYVAEHIQLLLVFSTHTFFLSGCAVETREFCGTVHASNRVFPQPARPYSLVSRFRNAASPASDTSTCECFHFRSPCETASQRTPSARRYKATAS